MKITKAKIVDGGILINDAYYLPNSNNGHIRVVYDEWVAAGNSPAAADGD